jgi:hypothetical protein
MGGSQMNNTEQWVKDFKAKEKEAHKQFNAQFQVNPLHQAGWIVLAFIVFTIILP